MTLTVLALLAALVAAPANIKGTWDGTLTSQRPDGTTSETPTLFVLDQKDGTVTGTIGGNETDQHPITSGSIDGDKVVIDAKHTNNGREFHLELTIENDEMKGTVRSGDRTGQLTVKRRKE
jgi:hypothetical protein